MDFARYQRQLLVPEFGKKGQQILSEKHAVIIGGGGLGSNLSDLLVRIGIGSLDIIDDDTIDLTNIHRTSLFTEDDIGQKKSQVLADKLQKINHNVSITAIPKRFTKDNAVSLTTNADIVLDGTDNMKTRFLINDISLQQNIAWVYAGVYSTVGMVMAILPYQTPCLKCIAQNIPEKTADVPVLGNLTAMTACIECTEALKILLGKQLSGLLIYDVWNQQFDQIKIQKNPQCLCCGSQHDGAL